MFMLLLEMLSCKIIDMACKRYDDEYILVTVPYEKEG